MQRVSKTPSARLKVSLVGVVRQGIEKGLELCTVLAEPAHIQGQTGAGPLCALATLTAGPFRAGLGVAHRHIYRSLVRSVTCATKQHIIHAEKRDGGWTENRAQVRWAK